jgi:23S rRNA (cytosine1962-C5)-methyltransferase
MAVRGGHPWVFANRIREQNRAGTLGDLAILYDRQDRFLALGLYDPESVLRVRVLHTGAPVALDLKWWAQRLESALAKRRGTLGDDTTGWRCLHGENDGWPGLVLDRYAEVFVLKLYTAAWLPRLEQLLPVFRAVLQPRSLILRLSRNITALAQRDFRRSDGDLLLGEPVTGPVIFHETGLRFEADVLRGQKTGFFLDQRDNRRIIGSLSKGARVLNAFSFSGGFSLYAARGGASAITDIDISPYALQSARRNFELNRGLRGVETVIYEGLQADVFDWLAEERARHFDLVILDPPSLAKRESERAGALMAYGRLARLGAARLRSGGVLLACSCSAHVSAADFWGVVREELRRAHFDFEELQTTRHPPDHPAVFSEAHYLKAIYLRVLAHRFAQPRSGRPSASPDGTSRRGKR